MGLEQVWDHLPSLEAVLRAWQEPGWPEGFRPRDAVRIDRAGLRGRRAVGGDR